MKQQKIGMQPEFFKHINAFTKQEHKVELKNVEIKINPYKASFNNINTDNYLRMIKFDNMKPFQMRKNGEIPTSRNKQETLKLVSNIPVFKKPLEILNISKINQVGINRPVNLKYDLQTNKNNVLTRNIDIAQSYNATKKFFEKLDKPQKKTVNLQTINPNIVLKHNQTQIINKDFNIKKNFNSNSHKILQTFNSKPVSNFKKDFNIKNNVIEHPQNLPQTYNLIKSLNFKKDFKIKNNVIENSRTLPQTFNSKTVSNFKKDFKIKNNVIESSQKLPQYFNLNGVKISRNFKIKNVSNLHNREITNTLININPQKGFHNTPVLSFKTKNDLTRKPNIDFGIKRSLINN